MNRKASSFRQRVVLSVIFMLIFVYAFYHFVGLFGSDIETYAAGVTTETTVLSEQGYLFRDETVLYSSYSGTVDYLVRDGTKVSKGQALASVYEQGSSEATAALRRLDVQIALLEQSIGDALNGVEMGELKEDVKETYLSLVKMLAVGDPSELAKKKETFLVELNQMEGLSKQESAEAYTTLESLRAQRQTILQGGGGSWTYSAERSGYFYGYTDGYEEFFTMDAVDRLTAESFDELIAKRAAKQPNGETAYGKLCFSSEWKLVLPAPADFQSYFEEADVYSGEFTDNGRAVIPLTFERAVESSDSQTVLLIFSADRLPDNFSFDRTQSVKIDIDTVSGIYVPKNVVERADGFRGVYILRGSVVYFRRIEIVYEGSDYYLVKAGLTGEDVSYLQVNDLIILNGKNMFDGRVLD